MDQRRLRLGDILDDYCPRERRITNHAVVALVEDEVKQTRCTTCDAEHEYKHAKVPAARRKKSATPTAHLVDAASRVPPETDTEDVHEDAPAADMPVMTDAADVEPSDEVEPIEIAAAPSPAADAAPESETVDEESSERDEWPVHRPLIRATLPRPEGQAPERKAPDFTFRPGGGKFDQNRNGQRPRGHRPTRQGHGQGQPGQGGSRFGGPRPSGQGQRGPGYGGGQPGQRHGNRSGQGQGGGNVGRPGQGPGRGPRPGGGRKRGR
jgi:translation initiation factor IF-2